MSMTDLDKAFAAAIIAIAKGDTAVAQANDVSRTNTRKENKNRHATAEMTYITTGVGQVRFKAPVIFPIRFRTEPQFANGSGVKKHPLPKLWHDPRGTAGVRGWVRDGDGYYTGAYVWLRVDIESLLGVSDTASPPPVQVLHFLTFTGIAVKEVPDISDLTPRKVDI